MPIRSTLRTRSKSRTIFRATSRFIRKFSLLISAGSDSTVATQGQSALVDAAFYLFAFYDEAGTFAFTELIRSTIRRRPRYKITISISSAVPDIPIPAAARSSSPRSTDQRSRSTN